MTRQTTRAVRTALLWFLLELIAAAQVQTGEGRLLGVWVRTATAPLAWTAAWLGSSGAGVVETLRSHAALANDSLRLQHERDAAVAQVFLLREQVAVLAEGRHLASLVQAQLLDANLTYCSFRDLVSGRMRVMGDLPAGRFGTHAALAADGLLGRVTSVEPTGAWIELITHPAAAVAVTSADRSLQALAAGTGGGTLEVQFVARQAPVVRGDILISSGADGIYPAGFPVARVVSVREADGPFLEVWAVPVADLARIRVVLITGGAWPRFKGEPAP